MAIAARSLCVITTGAMKSWGGVIHVAKEFAQLEFSRQ
jgi:hypothetical protein